MKESPCNVSYLNASAGCSHFCRYCPFARQSPCVKNYPREFILAVAVSIAGKLANTGRRVVLSKACDPFPDDAEVISTSLAALEILISKKIQVEVSTKGGDRARPALDILKKHRNSQFAISLGWTRQEDADFWEPGAASIESRIAVFEAAWRKCISTCLCLGPVIDQEQALHVAQRLKPFTDLLAWGAPYKDNGRVDFPLPKMPWSEFARRLAAIFEGSNVRIQCYKCG